MRFPVDDVASPGIVPNLSLTTGRADASGDSLSEPAGVVLVATPMPVRVTYLEVRQAPDDRVVTVVEILSPTNKMPGSGRTDYVRKREDILASHVNLVEIDLLRGGRPMPLTTPTPPCHYRILVSRERWRPSARLFPFTVQDAIPKFPLPLLDGDTEIETDVGPLLDAMHHTGRYNMAVDYDSPPPAPELDAASRQWLDNRLTAFRQAA